MSQVLTLVVVYHNEESVIGDLLKSIELQRVADTKNKFDLLFIDNNSRDHSSGLIDLWIEKNALTNVKHIHRSLNHMGLARQQALELATTPWIVFVDADSQLKPDWSKNIFRILNDVKTSVVAVGGGSDYLGTQSWHAFAKSLAQYFPMERKFSQRVKVKHVPTNNYLIRKKEALEAGGFDSFFNRVGEDLDFNVRLRQKGTIVFDPSFSVFHHLPNNIYDWYRKMALYGRAQSYVLLKYRGGLPKEKFIPLIFCLILNLGLIWWPLSTVFLLFFTLLIPRIRFFVLTFLFYGMGEFVGVLKYIFIRKWLRSLILDAGQQY